MTEEDIFTPIGSADVYAREEIEKVKRKVELLSNAASSSNMRSMDLQAERDRTDAVIAASEARGDTKIARMDSKLDALLVEIRGARTDNKSNRNVIATTMIGSVLALAGLAYAVISYGAAQFSNGAMVRDVAAHVAHVRPITPSH